MGIYLEKGEKLSPLPFYKLCCTASRLRGEGGGKGPRCEISPPEKSCHRVKVIPSMRKKGGSKERPAHISELGKVFYFFLSRSGRKESGGGGRRRGREGGGEKSFAKLNFFPFLLFFRPVSSSRRLRSAAAKKRTFRTYGRSWDPFFLGGGM